MPTYEYECKSCEHTFEVFQSITAKPIKKCEKCGKAVKRLIGSGAAVIFKGSGFYETDYKRAASKKEDSKPDCSSDCPHKEACPASKKSD